MVMACCACDITMHAMPTLSLSPTQSSHGYACEQRAMPIRKQFAAALQRQHGIAGATISGPPPGLNPTLSATGQRWSAQMSGPRPTRGAALLLASNVQALLLASYSACSRSRCGHARIPGVQQPDTRWLHKPAPHFEQRSDPRTPLDPPLHL